MTSCVTLELLHRYNKLKRMTPFVSFHRYVWVSLLVI